MECGKTNVLKKVFQITQQNAKRKSMRNGKMTLLELLSKKKKDLK